jgi:hypothetical protein
MTAISLFLRTYWLQLGILAALVLGVWYIDHRGYQRAKHHYEEAEAKAQQRADELARRIEKTLTDKLAEMDQRTAQRISAIDVEERTVVMPTITREIRNDPRLSDPSSSISDGLLGALNQARRRSSDSSAPRER